jgi:hypothetical protein
VRIWRLNAGEAAGNAFNGVESLSGGPSASLFLSKWRELDLGFSPSANTPQHNFLDC